jgi:hypothetical protein
MYPKRKANEMEWQKADENRLLKNKPDNSTKWQFSYPLGIEHAP